MKIIGYTDPMTIAQSERLAVKVSAVADYDARLVRLVHGDRSCKGPGFKAHAIDADVAGHYRGKLQPIHTGSCIVVERAEPLRLSGAFTLGAWIWPTLPGAGAQALLGCWDPGGNRGCGLFLGDDGALELWIGDGRAVHRFSSGMALRAREWSFVAACRAADGLLRLVQRPQPDWPRGGCFADVVHAGTPAPAPAEGPFTMAACVTADGAFRNCYNGKLEAPVVFDAALDDAALAGLHDRGAGAAGRAPLAAWDFARDFATDRVTDRSANALHGRAVNLPARAMTGHAWTGAETNFRHAPQQYAAIHFHDDDLEDARWDTDFEYAVPADLPSGVYAFHLQCGDSAHYLPFFVRPGRGIATARAAILIPTASYLAYANESYRPSDLDLAPHQHADISREHYAFVDRNRLQSCYDRHPDGSGVCFSSRLRPIADFRPDHVHGSIDAPHGIAEDLYLVDWMEAKGIGCDVITDEILHLEGLPLLAPYKVVLSGAHPEYWSEEMLDAVEAYLERGGRFMYLGGNGLYWVTSFLPGRPHAIEVRRAEGVRSWQAAPGELYHAASGQRGGLWRSRGRAPQRLVGVGFTAQGFDFCRPYRRTEQSRDPRAAFIFEGIGEEELIGDHPALVLERGAAGFEIDRFDPELGSPPHALCVASSFGHSNAYQHTVEEVRSSNSKQGGRIEPRVRSDMVFFETANGGAVFSAGSIAWTASLSWNAYHNTVSRVTENVLRRFLSDEPFR
jgi:N,N-dimethylformamidase